MGLMRTLAIGAAGYWLYRSGRLDPYLRQLKESSLFQQLKDKAGMGAGSTTATPSVTTTSYGSGAEFSDPTPARPRSTEQHPTSLTTPEGGGVVTTRGNEAEPHA